MTNCKCSKKRISIHAAFHVKDKFRFPGIDVKISVAFM